MKRNISTNNFHLKFLLVLVCVLLSISCQADETALQDDVTAKAGINKINSILVSGQKLKTEDMESAKAILEKYPESETAQTTYKSALIKRGDWASLEQFLSSLPPEKLSDEDRINLGKTYMKLGRFKEAVKTLEPFAEGDNLELKSILANAHFQLGEYDNAKNLLDKNWEEINKVKRVEDITLRGTIYFHEKEYDKAIETLDKSLEIKPNDITAANSLSRVYAAKGDTKKADEYQEKVQAGFDRMTAEETRKTKIVNQLYKLQEAYKAKRFQEVINIAKEIMPEIDAKNKPALMQYLFNSYKSLGMTKEAQEVMAQAKQMQQKQ